MKRHEVPTGFGTSILPLYLREMGVTPLLQKEDEGHLGRILAETREQIAQIFRGLPKGLQDSLVPDGVPNAKNARAWTFEDLDSAYVRLLSAVRTVHSAGSPVAVPEILVQAHREAAPLKRSLDRARDDLTLANLRLVVYLAKKYLHRGVAFLDLIQEGSLGLLKAVDKFEYERGYKFGTYAHWWIKQSIERAIADKARIIRVPVNTLGKLKKILDAKASLVMKLGRRPTPSEIAEFMGVSAEKVSQILARTQSVENLDDSPFPEEDGTSVLEFLADEQSLAPDEGMLREELGSGVCKALALLTSREEKVMQMRFGIGGDVPMTLQEIGKRMGLSRERVRQIEFKTLNKIRADPKFQALRAYLVKR